MIDASLDLLPAKIRAWANLIMTIGVSGVIAIYLVWIQAKTLPDIKDRVTAIQISADLHRDEAIRAIAKQQELLEKLLLTQQIVCAQGETTVEGKRRCFGE